MKWRIFRVTGMPSRPWKVTGWTWIEDLGDWTRVETWQPTHAAAVEAMNDFRAARPHQIEEAPC